MLAEFLNPSGRTLTQLGQELGCSRQSLCMVGRRLAELFSMRASWQRSDQAREVYRKRATLVHRGEWDRSPHWERHLLRHGLLKPAATKGKPTTRAKRAA